MDRKYTEIITIYRFYMVFTKFLIPMMQPPDGGKEYCSQIHAVNHMPFINFAKSPTIIKFSEENVHLQDHILKRLTCLHF